MAFSIKSKDLKVLCFDMCSNKNAGDEAMQTALFELILNSDQSSKISMAARFGKNQQAQALNEFDAFKGLDNIELLTGAYPTYVHFRSSEGTVSKILRKIQKALAALLISPLLFCLSCGLDRLATVFASLQGGDLLDRARRCDLIIWNGRNIRRVEGTRGYFKLVELIANAALMAMVKKRKVMYGASFWPIKSGFYKWLLKGVMAKYDTIYVRETESFKIAEALGLKNVSTMPDLSFYFLKNRLADHNKIEIKAERDPRVAITLVGARELSDAIGVGDYVDLIASAIGYLHKRYSLSPVIVRQVTYGPEVEDDIIALLSRKYEGITVLPPPKTIDDLLDVYSRCRLLLATRMHSAIFSISCSTPVVALPYDWKGKWQILYDLGLPKECMHPLKEVCEKDMVAGLDIALSQDVDWGSMAQAVQDEADRLRILVEADCRF